MTLPFKRPQAVLFDLFHTLICVPPPGAAGERPLTEILGVPSAEFTRRYYEDDVLGRCLGHVTDGMEAMRRVTHSLDPTIPESRIVEAVASRRRRFEMAFTGVEAGMLSALDRLRAAGIRTALVSDAGADDVDDWWHRSSLSERLDVTVFSYRIGIRKPDPRIYQRALDALGVAPEAACFVGDGGSDEHRGARAVGLPTVLVTRLMATWWPERIPERRIHADCEFEDVPAFVDALGLDAG